MVVDYTVYNMNFAEIGREYNLCGTTVKYRIFKKINQMKYWLSVIDTPNKARGLYYGKRAII